MRLALKSGNEYILGPYHSVYTSLPHPACAMHILLKPMKSYLKHSLTKVHFFLAFRALGHVEIGRAHV